VFFFEECNLRERLGERLKGARAHEIGWRRNNHGAKEVGMAKNWVLVADSASARIFSMTGPRSSLQEIETLDHPEGRLPAQEINADRPGRSFASAGKRRHAMEREVDPKKQAAITFAREIVERLESARAQGDLERLILVAAPEFLGLLREHLSSETKRAVENEFALNLAAMAPDEIRAHLPEKLFSTLTSG
jgi:protein required for attachment to host cells